jgi:hypothetical protein
MKFYYIQFFLKIELYNNVTTCPNSNPSVCSKIGKTKTMSFETRKKKGLFEFIFNNYTMKVKTHYGGAKNVVTLYSFSGVSMFELQPW